MINLSATILASVCRPLSSAGSDGRAQKDHEQNRKCGSQRIGEDGRVEADEVLLTHQRHVTPSEPQYIKARVTNPRGGTVFPK